MKRFNFLGALGVSLSSVALVALSSCSTPYNIAYFQDMPLEKEVKVAKPQEVILQPGDQISILVSTRDAALSSLFSLYSNYSVGESSGGGSNYGRNDSYYIIDADGTIDFPVLGRIPVAGKTRSELELYIKTRSGCNHWF